MKAVFLGGGSLRLIPIFRGIFNDTPDAFANGEIRLADLNLQAAEAVAAVLKQCPEFPQDCKVIATSDTDRALEGCDILYLTMAARTWPRETLAKYLAQEYGFLSSDQLSINGAFLAVKLGPFIFSLAKKLERLSPKAKMLIFPNPVSVYSAMVNNNSSIKALGICGGFNNHRFDLTRILGRDEFDPNWNVVATGVNHLSFITRGEYKGRDIFDVIDEAIKGDWHCIDVRGGEYIKPQLERYVELYRRYRVLIFSTEGDGMTHITYEYSIGKKEDAIAARAAYDTEKAKQDFENQRKERYQALYDAASGRTPIDWKNGGPFGLFKRQDLDISLPIFKALAGHGSMRITASRPNMGAVKGFEDRAALEYTMDLSKDGIVPVPDQYVPHPWKGLIASLSEFQTILADALAQNDPKLFADALEAYPMNRGRNFKREFIRKMFELYNDMNPIFYQAKSYFE